MADYEQYLEGGRALFASEATALAKEILTLRKLLWLNHGHKGMYGDDGEMQCGECMQEFGFWDWKRTPINEIESKIQIGNLRKVEKALQRVIINQP